MFSARSRGPSSSFAKLPSPVTRSMPDSSHFMGSPLPASGLSFPFSQRRPCSAPVAAFEPNMPTPAARQRSW